MNYLQQEIQGSQEPKNKIFDFVQENSLDGLWYWDLKNPDNTWVNTTFWKSIGYDGEHEAERPADWRTVVAPADLAAVEAQLAACVAGGTSNFTQLVQCTHRDQSAVWLQCQGLIMRDDDGQQERLVGVLLDVTKEKIALATAHEFATHYSTILSNQSVYIIRTNTAGNYTYVNDFFCERFGYDAKIIGTSSMDSIYEDDRPKCIATVMKCFTEPEKPHQVILRKPYRDNTVKSNHWEFKGIVNGAGELVEILCVGYDVTLLVENFEKSQHLLEVTKQQNARLQNFAHIISHNIRSHSANLTSLVRFLQEAKGAEQTAMFLQMLKTSTDKLAETIVNLNEIVTANSNAHQPRKPRSLQREVNKTLEALNVLIHQNSIAVLVNIPADVTVHVVPAYLDSILLNLLSNAIKYRSPQEAATIEVTTHSENEYIVLSIKDNGLGIDLDRHGAKVFGMYKTFHKNEDARGVGLFITKNQIEAMGGKINVQSKLGNGSTFNVYFNEGV